MYAPLEGQQVALLENSRLHTTKDKTLQHLSPPHRANLMFAGLKDERSLAADNGCASTAM